MFSLYIFLNKVKRVESWRCLRILNKQFSVVVDFLLFECVFLNQATWYLSSLFGFGVKNTSQWLKTIFCLTCLLQRTHTRLYLLYILTFCLYVFFLCILQLKCSLWRLPVTYWDIMWTPNQGLNPELSRADIFTSDPSLQG